MTEIVTINEIGAAGDGIAIFEDQKIYVPFSLLGEEIEIDLKGNRGKIIKIINASTQRVKPLCEYFESCGGCAFQHWNENEILAWKGKRISQYAPKPIEPKMANAWTGGRRRAKFNASLTPQGIKFGFMGQKSHEIIDIKTCPVLSDNFNNFLVKLRELARVLVNTSKPVTFAVTEATNGFDIGIEGLKPIQNWPMTEKEKLARAANEAGCLRLTLNGEIAYSRQIPFVEMGKAKVEITPNGFLQATKECENQLSQAVLEFAKGSKKIADLFSGYGTFALRLKEIGEVFAYEISSEAVLALKSSAKRLAGGHELHAFTRDLFLMPVSPIELKKIDCVILDPPRAGAKAQVSQLAKSKVSKIVYVSCDAQSFWKDAEILLHSGYELKEIRGFDQFRFSAHLELIGLFVKNAP